MEKNNFYKITGVVYEKIVRTVVSKKKQTEGQSFDFPSLVLEIKQEFKGKTYSDLVEFEPAGKNVNFDLVNQGDEVEIAFALGGKEEPFTDREGRKQKRIRNRIKAIGVRKTGANNNVNTGVSPQLKDEGFPEPPSAFDDPENDSSLPF